MKLASLASFLTSLALLGFAHAAAPVLEGIWPAGGQIGAEFEAEVVGTFDPWPVRIWCENPGVSLTCGEKKGRLQVKIANNAETGPFLVRFFNDEGASEPKILVVGKIPEITEDGGENGRHDSPQNVESLPAIVNGRLEKAGDADFYRFSLKKGDRLAAKLDGYSLGSPIDPFLHLFAPNGREVAFGSVSHNLDPKLVHVARETGDYTLLVAAIDHKATTNVNFAGKQSAIYRLSLQTGAVDLAAFPTGATPAKSGDRLSVPGRFAASFEETGQRRHEFRLSAKKGQKVLLRVESQVHETALDAVLKVVRPDERDYRIVDDLRTNRDPELLLTAPLDGDYSVQIQDRFLRGGPEFRYHLVLAEPEPDFAGTADKSALMLKTGETAEVKIKLERKNGHKAPLGLEIPDLPAGVSLKKPEIPEKSGEITAILAATKDAAPANVPLRLSLRETEGESPKNRDVVFSFQTTGSRGAYLVNQTPILWLTVQKPAEKAPEKAAKQ